MDLTLTGPMLTEEALAVSVLTAIAHLRAALHQWGTKITLALEQAPSLDVSHDDAVIRWPHQETEVPLAMVCAPCWAGQNCSVLMLDVARFAAPHRTDTDRLFIRRTIYKILKSACDDSGIPWATCHHEDRGDGVLIVLPPTTPTCLAVYPLLPRLRAGLRRHNRCASEATRIQLRVALDVGPVTPDEEGVSGEVIIRTARMLDAPVFKRDLARSNADLGFITSPFVYDTVIRHDPDNIDPATYRRLGLRVKESRLSAWMHLGV